jgi:pyrroloquinoline quinone (PQQ) biosynthesis protein C
LLLLDNNQDVCNVELRPKGLIIRFRSLLETYAIVIPYYKLSIFKGTASSYTIHAEAKKIEVEMDSKVTRFFSKITKQKAAYLSDFK